MLHIMIKRIFFAKFVHSILISEIINFILNGKLNSNRMKN